MLQYRTEREREIDSETDSERERAETRRMALCNDTPRKNSRNCRARRLWQIGAEKDDTHVEKRIVSERAIKWESEKKRARERKVLTKRKRKDGQELCCSICSSGVMMRFQFILFDTLRFWEDDLEICPKYPSAGCGSMCPNEARIASVLLNETHAHTHLHAQMHRGNKNNAHGEASGLTYAHVDVETNLVTGTKTDTHKHTPNTDNRRDTDEKMRRHMHTETQTQTKLPMRRKRLTKKQTHYRRTMQQPWQSKQRSPVPLSCFRAGHWPTFPTNVNLKIDTFWSCV